MDDHYEMPVCLECGAKGRQKHSSRCSQALPAATPSETPAPPVLTPDHNYILPTKLHASIVPIILKARDTTNSNSEFEELKKILKEFLALQLSRFEPIVPAPVYVPAKLDRSPDTITKMPEWEEGKFPGLTGIARCVKLGHAAFSMTELHEMNKAVNNWYLKSTISAVDLYKLVYALQGGKTPEGRPMQPPRRIDHDPTRPLPWSSAFCWVDNLGPEGHEFCRHYGCINTFPAKDAYAVLKFVKENCR